MYVYVRMHACMKESRIYVGSSPANFNDLVACMSICMYEYMYKTARLYVYILSSFDLNPCIDRVYEHLYAYVCMYFNACMNLYMHRFECMKVSCIYESSCTRSVCMSNSYFTSIIVNIP
jgi:hypothetical protein